MNKIITIILLLFGMSSWVYSQVITVRNKETGGPVQSVVISVGTTSVETNSNGQADISAFKSAEFIDFYKEDYKKSILSYVDIQALNFEIELVELHLKLNEVVVTGTKWKQFTKHIPFKITKISSEEVALHNPQTAADLLSLSGKVYVQKSQQGGGSPMIRGFSTNRLLYTIDGVRMNTAIFRGGNLQNVISLDPFAIEGTEVLFGPGSVIYGSDAIGGVMSFQTLTPQLSKTDKPTIGGKVNTRYSSANNEKTGHFDVNVGWKKWAFVTSVSSWDYDHLRQGSNGPDDYIKSIHVQRQDSTDVIVAQEDPLLQIPSAYSQINLMQKVRFKPNENWDFQYGFHYSETSPYGRYDRNTRYKNGTLRYAEWNYGPQIWIMNNLSMTHHGENVMYDEMSLRLAHQYFQESRIDRTLNKADRSNNEENVDAYSLNLDFSKTLGKKNNLFYGVEYIFNDVSSIGKITDITTDVTTLGASRYPNSTWSSMALYLNDEFKVSEKFTAMAGVRYNHYVLDADFSNNLAFYPFSFSSAKIDDGSVTGSVGVVYRPSQSWVLSTNVGTAFRSPNIDDIGKVFDSEPGAVTMPNPDLKAEYAYNFDVGIAKVFGDFIKVDVTGFYTLLENALVRRNFQLNGSDSIMYDGVLSQVQAIQNAAKANVYGVQAGLEIKLSKGVSLLSHINYQVGEEEQDDGSISASRHAAPLFGVTRLNFKVKQLQLQFYSNYMAERKHEDLPISEQSKVEIYAKDINGNTYSPAWYTVNLKAQYMLSKTFSISTGVENITDQRYRPYSSGISAPGRNFVLAAKANF